MPEKFNMQAPPFDRLTEKQQRTLRASLDVAYYRDKETIIAAEQPSHYLYILIKGAVEERSADGKEVFAHYANDDMFDVRALFESHTKHQYITRLESSINVMTRCFRCAGKDSEITFTLIL